MSCLSVRTSSLKSHHPTQKEAGKEKVFQPIQGYPGIPTTIETMGVNITTIVYLRVVIIQIGSTIILMVVEA